jgi:hypothetical protein
MLRGTRGSKNLQATTMNGGIKSEGREFLLRQGEWEKILGKTLDIRSVGSNIKELPQRF